MDLKLSEKTCLVTGASTGIGRATALMLAAEGARLVVTARSIEPLTALAVEMRAAGGRDPVVLTADFTQPDGAQRLATQVVADVGPIDVLVNNAGGSRPLVRPDDDAAWDEALLLNFLSARRLTDRLLPGMLQRQWGRIV